MARALQTGRRRATGGFAYLLLLITLAVLGVVAAGSVSLGAALGRRDAEQHLLAIGTEFHQALRTYAGVPPGSPVPPGAGPRQLEDLLKDPRTPELRRHLRKVPADPMTGRVEWGLLTDEQERIIGVYSLAEGTPLKTSGFTADQEGFEGATKYSDWVFGPRQGIQRVQVQSP